MIPMPFREIIHSDSTFADVQISMCEEITICGMPHWHMLEDRWGRN